MSHVVGQQSVLTSMYSVEAELVFPGSHSLHLAFGSFFHPHPSLFIVPLDIPGTHLHQATQLLILNNIK